MSAVSTESLRVTNPDKLLYPETGVTKLDYVRTLLELAPYLLPHTSGRVLTAIRYPHGAGGEFFYQKHLPQKAPDFVSAIEQGGELFIDLNRPETLAWLGNLAALEFHTPFCTEAEGMLRALVFDMDPSEGQNFTDAAECALLVRDTLRELGIESLVKTSGASGLQIYIPCAPMTFERGRRVNEFFGQYFSAKYPDKITIERLVKNRGSKLYFDYLQMGPGKSIITVYSPRAVPCAAVSMPVDWDELQAGVKPCDFTLRNAAERLAQRGERFAAVLQGNPNAALEEMMRHARL